MVFNYNNNKFPKRPECQLYIGNPMEEDRVRLNMLAVADTGASMTMIPIDIIERLGNVIEGDMVRVVYADGSSGLKETYLVDLYLESHKFSRYEVIATLKNHALIGRDILNENKAYFNAPQNCWHLNCLENCPGEQNRLILEETRI